MTASEFLQLLSQRDRIQMVLESHNSYTFAMKIHKKIHSLAEKREELKRELFRKKNTFIKRISAKKLFEYGVYDVPHHINTLENEYPSSDYSVRWKHSFIYPHFMSNYIEIRGLESEEKWQKRKEKIQAKIDHINSTLSKLDEDFKDLFESSEDVDETTN